MTDDRALPVGNRPFTDESFSTDGLPDTPVRTYRIPASGWKEAPQVLLTLGDDLGETPAYLRRIHGWLLWRAGPPVGEARYLAISDDGSTHWAFALHGKRGEGLGPDGEVHERFRTWKEGLRDHPPAYNQTQVPPSGGTGPVSEANGRG